LELTAADQTRRKTPPFRAGIEGVGSEGVTGFSCFPQSILIELFYRLRTI
jgi:hypothetical protein